MSKHTHRHSHHRPSSDWAGGLFSEEFLYGATGGMYVLPPRNSGQARHREYQAGDTFEETYPKYPFSELVRLSIDLAKWLVRRRNGRASEASDNPPALGTYDIARPEIRT